MMKKWFQRAKNEKGLTLIELLAVVVILGIIAAIAVPSIGGIIDNSKKDAHVANAQQMINSARLAVTGNPSLQPQNNANTKVISLKYLEEEGYIETIADPDSGGYLTGTAAGGARIGDNSQSYVLVTRDNTANFSFSVKLLNGIRGVQTSSKGPVNQEDLSRDSVLEN
ncbi:competence type IV pilus major pilin ComGC [Halalkalibacter nanhaiisediminis]|uniref:Type IV pilus assembly protein PilA n=1 Tax=Halalkalibacter nanhaiisediminis TaxID=688079 RepID=A0A562QM24_9BACI|nr:type II secretion system protein [Halalkalibacter nanhaiisediminis]TWI57096.1 type IV pilus assembly protein PilA [Halalkalibacter nanhaiisediminis]